MNKFKCTGSVKDEPRSGWPSTSNENILSIRQSIERSPKSLCSIAREQNILVSIGHKVLNFRLEKVYHFQVLYNPHEEDKAECGNMCVDLLVVNENHNLMSHILFLFSDEVTFHICGKVNRH